MLCHYMLHTLVGLNWSVMCHGLFVRLVSFSLKVRHQPASTANMVVSDAGAARLNTACLAAVRRSVGLTYWSHSEALRTQAAVCNIPDNIYASHDL